MTKNIVNLAENLMAKSEVLTLASVNEDGFPRICAMANVKSGDKARPVAGLVHRALPQGRGRPGILRPEVRGQRGHDLHRRDFRDGLSLIEQEKS